MFTLISLGVGIAYTYSLFATLFPGALANTSGAADGSPPVYFESAAVITALVLLGQVLELRSRESTAGAIKALLQLAPPTARLVRADGTDEDVALELVKPEDLQLQIAFLWLFFLSFAQQLHFGLIFSFRDRNYSPLPGPSTRVGGSRPLRSRTPRLRRAKHSW